MRQNGAFIRSIGAFTRSMGVFMRSRVVFMRSVTVLTRSMDELHSSRTRTRAASPRRAHPFRLALKEPRHAKEPALVEMAGHDLQRERQALAREAARHGDGGDTDQICRGGETRREVHQQ